MWAKLRNNFIAGVAAILPTIITILIIRYLFVLINGLVLNPILGMFEPYVKGTAAVYFKYLIKVLTLLVVIGIVVLIGMATRSIIVRRLASFGERLLYKIPFFSKVYTSIRQITQAFFVRGEAIFKRVVLVEYPRKGVYSLGFVTSKSREEVQQKTHEELLNVFIPTTPNPTSGVLLMVPKESALELEMPVEDGLKLVISGGAVTPPYKGGPKSSG